MAYNFKKNKKNNGVDDMTLISKLSEDEVMQNLKKRFANDSIYTYIGDVLISVNPFRFIPGLTSAEMIESYKGKFTYENPPHVFALAEKTYRNMVGDRENQCVLITGESGAGKTEASKLIMQYIAAVSGNGDGVERVKKVILESNPLLEAFGNAKTLRNNNSSRFGKYFEIQFDTKGDPCGGKVTNYLLEKSRVVYQISGERNFHIFYQMCAGLTPEERQIYATNDPRDFHYLNQGKAYTVEGMDDAEEFRATRKAMSEIGMSKQEQDNIFKLVAGILWLGNITFVESSNGQSQIADQATLQYAAYLLGVSELALQQALLYRVITTGIGRRGSTYNVPQTPEQASIIRDALAKTLYDRMFDWLVERVNKAFVNTVRDPLVIGVLDIYGFEIFDKNGFEQLCINYTNEKLQQIFIDQTLKAEQDEYKQEGIKWTPIKFFNNKIVCDLIEENRPPGILGVLDDTCHTTHAMDSSKADEKFIQRLSDTISNPHLFLRGDEFTIRHYAGDVSYSIEGFTEKNKDVLYNTLVDCMQSSNDPWIRDFFPEKLSEDSKKRPTTAGFKIKKSCNDLVVTLKKCVPSYIRCIKPNETKQPKDFDSGRVLHQVKYLGLLENIRVRRAGFAYRHFFDKFLERFCLLSKKTWPLSSWHGDAKSGCEAILTEMGIESGEYQFGLTKIFLRHPETLFGLEEAKERKYHDSASLVARTWRRYKLRRYYLDLRSSATNLLQNSKERRRLSINRVYLGDYINYGQNAQVQEIMKPHRDEGGIVFADILYKPVRKRKGLSTIIVSEQAFLLVTSVAIYIIERVKVKKQMLTQLTSRITWSKLQSIEMSTLCDNYLVLKRAGEVDEDIFGECNNKTEFLSIVNDQYKKSMNRDVSRNFSNELVFMGPKKKKRSVQFIKDPTGKFKLAKLSGSGTKWKIEISEGLPPTTQPKTIQYKSRTTVSAGGATSRAPGLPMAFQSSPVQEQNYRSQSFKAPQPALHNPPQQNQFATQSYMFGQQKQFGGGAPAPAPRAKAPPPLPKRDTRPKCKAMYDYDAAADDELTLRNGDIVTIIRKDPSGWWEGEVAGRVGLFPGNYCVDI